MRDLVRDSALGESERHYVCGRFRSIGKEDQVPKDLPLHRMHHRISYAKNQIAITMSLVQKKEKEKKERKKRASHLERGRVTVD